ncbi:MAG: thermonuclease family protein [Thermoflexales bacterium]
MAQRRLLIAVFLVAFVGFVLSETFLNRSARDANPALPPGEDALVTRVVDGDTIQVQINGVSYRVRYIGVDAPESTKQVDCFGLEASAFNQRLVGGQTVRLERDVNETDRYGRLLRYVYLLDGRMVNEELVREGYAIARTFPPDVKHVDRLRRAEQEARQTGRGLWSACSIR